MKNMISGKLIAQSLCLSSLAFLTSITAASAWGSKLADDTLIVVTKKGYDTARLKAEIVNGAHATQVHELHANRDKWSILLVTPPSGQREAVLAKLATMRSAFPEIGGLSRNCISWHSAYGSRDRTSLGGDKKKKGGGGSGGHGGFGSGGGGGGSGGGGGGTTYATPPNDTDFSYQWPLTEMNWPAAQSTYLSSQTGAAHVTILATGVQPNTTANELGNSITQYNCTGINVTTEPLKDVDEGTAGANTPGEGSLDCQMSGSLTDNKTALAGAASFGPYPVDIVMLRISTAQQPNSASEAAIDTALMWALNNQSARGGAGPINLSYGVDIQQSGATPLWTSPDIVSFANSFANQGDLLVVSAGDSPGTWTGANAVIPTGCVVAQGSDQNNNLVNTLPAYGSGYGLTTVYGDPIAAPGTLQPVMGATGKIFQASFFGTSFSAPFVSASIALLRSVNSNLTSQQAFNLVVQTGTTAGAPTPAISPSWSVVVPNFAAALGAAKQ